MTAKRIATLPSQGGRVRALAISPDGKILAAGYEPQNLLNRGLTVLWNLPAKTLLVKLPFAAHALAFSPDGKLLALGGEEPAPPQGGRSSGGLKIWDIKQSREISNLIGHRGPVESVAFSPNGRMLASGGLEGTGILWDVGTGKLTTTLSEKLGQSPAIALSPDGETLALGSFNQEKGSTVADEVTFIELKTMKTRTKSDAGNNINALAFSHDGKTLAVGTGWATEGEVILLNTADGTRTASLRGHQDSVMDVAFTFDDTTLASGSTDKTVMLWDVSAKGLADPTRQLPKPLVGKMTPAKPPSGKSPQAAVGKAPPVELPAGEFPESVIKFHKSMQSVRELETVRLEKRLKTLKEVVRLGAKDAKNPVAREATVLLRKLNSRLIVVKSDKPYVPRLSPKDFAIGQIGELDDDLLMSTTKIEGGVARISVMFEEFKYFTGLRGSWSRSTVSRPDSFYVQADFAAEMPSSEKEYDRASPENLLLRSHVYEVVEGKNRGAITDFVLTPFKMDEVQVWLKTEEKRPKK